MQQACVGAVSLTLVLHHDVGAPTMVGRRREFSVPLQHGDGRAGGRQGLGAEGWAGVLATRPNSMLVWEAARPRYGPHGLLGSTPAV